MREMPQRRNTRALEPVVREAMLRQYAEERMLPSAIARLHDVHPQTVTKTVRRLGAVMRKPGRPETTGEFRRRQRGKWAPRQCASPQSADVHGVIDLTAGGS